MEAHRKIKIRKFRVEKYVTTPLISTLRTVQEMDVSIKKVSLSNESVVFVSQIEQIGDINRYDSCTSCKKRLIHVLLEKTHYF